MQEDKAFKTNDIRGIYPKEINENLAYSIGRAIVYKFKPKKLVIGRDARASSPLLFSSIVKGVLESGCEVIDIGLTSTPLFYYSVGETKADFGIMITASHNPGQYNGFKLVKKGVVPTTAKDIQELKEIVSSKKHVSSKNAKISYLDLSEKYVKRLVKESKIKKKLKVVVDTSNGMAAPIVSKAFSKLPISVIYINQKINMVSPRHEANPLKIETLKELQKEVKKNKADLGIAFDGDGDRVGFVDDKGEIIPMDLITALISKKILKQKRKAKIIYDLRSSNVVKETILESDGIPIEYKVGHSLIKTKMRKINSVFAGEVSGHYYLKDFNYSEAPIYICILLMNDINNNTISEIIKPLKRYYKTPELNYKINNPEKKIKELRDKFSSGKINDLDGLKIIFSDWWFNVRISHTESLLRLNLEANTKELMVRKLKEIEDIILR